MRVRDGRVAWVCVTAGTVPKRIYDLTAVLPFLELTSIATEVIETTGVADFLSAYRGRR